MMARSAFLIPLTAAAVLSAGASAASNLPRPSADCGECHKDIYRMWLSSEHAKAAESDIFLTAYRGFESRQGATAARLCLQCHAPLAVVAKDWKLERKASWDGVACDACHSLVSVEVTPTGVHQVLDVGEVKRGPIRDAVSSGHEVAFSELHTSSLGCAGCHEYINPEGTPILTTYTEWTQSEAAKEGKTCQTCHMARTKGQVVDPKVARLAEAEVNLHEMPGGHSLDQLNKALRVAIQPQHLGDSLLVEVTLTNRGAGHAVPTGMPGRRVILRLELRSEDDPIREESRFYGTTFLDASGEIIKRDGDCFAPGVKLDSDTRIGPQERRIETFRFPLAAGRSCQVTVRLNYEHNPTLSEEDRTFLTFFSETRAVPA